MTSLLLVTSMLVAFTSAQSSVNLITTPGASGSAVVEATVSRIQQSCIFGDDRRFLRRLAYVETLDGTDATFNGGNSGGIWKISTSAFTTLTAQSGSVLNSYLPKIQAEFGINTNTVTYSDLNKPLYSALAAALYTVYVIAASPVRDLPRSINNQANFWATYYRPGSSSSTFISRANSFENAIAKCNVGADIVFVIDESGSIGSRDYVIEKNFVVNVINNLVVGPNANQVGIITYSSTSVLDIKLNAYNNKNSLTNAVNSLSYFGGGTSTHLALAQLTDQAFTLANGARPQGKGHPRVGIVLTDGGSNSRTLTQTEAARAKKEGITLFSVGVGASVNVAELTGIASPPTCLRYSQLNSGFSEILDLVSSISATACSVPLELEPNNTFVKPVDPDVSYNCEITVPSNGVTVQLTTTAGNLTLFISNTTYPNQAYYDIKLSVKSGQTASVYIPPGQALKYCSIISGTNADVTVVVTPGKPTPSTFNCAQGRNPCSSSVYSYFFPGDNPDQYVQCGGGNVCYDMRCPAGLVWQQNILACNWPAAPTPAPSGGSGYTCAPPNPCTAANRAIPKYHFPHTDPQKFVQCDEFGGCFVMPCAQGTAWNDAYQTCDHAP